LIYIILTSFSFYGILTSGTIFTIVCLFKCTYLKEILLSFDLVYQTLFSATLMCPLSRHIKSVATLFIDQNHKIDCYALHTSTKTNNRFWGKNLYMCATRPDLSGVLLRILLDSYVHEKISIYSTKLVFQDAFKTKNHILCH